MNSSIKEMYLSFIIPVFNEEKRLKDNINKVIEFLNRLKKNYELIVIDDGSTDNTLNLLKRYTSIEKNLRIISYTPNRGKGYAVKIGMLEAKGELRMFSDIDLSTPVEEYYKLEAAIVKEGYDIAIGSRAVGNIQRKEKFYRKVMGKTFNSLVKLFLFSDINDTQCGFKCFTKEVAQKLFSLQKIESFAFDVEILYLAHLYNYKIKEIPVKWYVDPDTRVRLISASFQMLRDIFRIKFIHRDHSYETIT